MIVFTLFGSPEFHQPIAMYKQHFCFVNKLILGTAYFPHLQGNIQVYNYNIGQKPNAFRNVSTEVADIVVYSICYSFQK